jgi:hypothetical protein
LVIYFWGKESAPTYFQFFTFFFVPLFFSFPSGCRLVFRHFLAIDFEHLDFKTWDRPSLAPRVSPQTLRRFSALLLFSSGFLLPPLAFVRATATSVVKLPAWLPRSLARARDRDLVLFLAAVV